MNNSTFHGRIESMMGRRENRDKLEMLHMVATYIFGSNFIGGKTGAEVTAEAIHDQAHELEALKSQLPFLMNIKAGSSSDQKASSIYEDVYDQLVEMTDPHVQPESHGGTSINKNSLCCSIVDNYSALLEYWLATRNDVDFELGDTFVEGLSGHVEIED